MIKHRQVTTQTGLTYIEVLVAAALVAIALLPAVDALHTGILGNQVQQSVSDDHYAAIAKMEEVLAEQYHSILGAAAAAAGASTPSSYSDVAGLAARRLVFVALYDGDNADGDNNVFTVLDANLDGDGDPYTGYQELLWVRVEVEGSIGALDSLVGP